MDKTMQDMRYFWAMYQTQGVLSTPVMMQPGARRELATGWSFKTTF
jgi:hypothetical protein